MFSRVGARLAGNRFYCLALEGKGTTDICVNSDMTISCNCRDYDGTGIIGDLEKESWEDVFATGGARRFRQALAQGRFPTPHCLRCRQLRSAPREEVEKRLESYSLSPPGIMVENTAGCNYSCIGCANAEMLNTRKKLSMSPEDMGKVARIIHDHKIGHVDFFKLGEPFLSKNILEEMTILKELNPELDIITSTNGVFLDNEKKMEAALMFDTVYFAISGATQASLERYQAGGDFARAFGAMKRLVQLRKVRGLKKPWIFWRLLVFNWNDSRQETRLAINLAREAQVDMLQFVGAVNPLYGLSWRFYTSSFWRELGPRKGMTRMVHANGLTKINL